MTITVADIHRWDGGDVRDVAGAARSRGQAAVEAADGIADLSAFESWGGEASEAAEDANGDIRSQLRLHGEEAVAVADAADEAADAIDKVKSDLAQLESEAADAGLDVDPASNQIVAGPAIQGSILDLLAVEAKREELQARLDAILAEAALADQELAQAIKMATGAEAVPEPPPDSRPEIQEALSKPLPDDAREFHDLWERLTPEEKAWLYQQDHSIGNRDGMPAAERDHFNRLTLADELARNQAAAAQADVLRNQHPDWAEGRNVPPPNKPGAIFDDRLEYEEWQRRYDGALAGSRFLPDLQAVDRSVADKPDRRLMLLDTKSGEHAHAAIAVGDPDKADHVSVTTPGLNTTVAGGIEAMADEATHLRAEAQRQLGLTPGRELENVSTIAWIGYDAPQIPGADDLGGSLEGGWDVSRDTLAKAGGQDLAHFYDGLQASHEGVPAHLTAVGHSYGSLTTGLALQEPGDHGVTDAIFYGSPGIEASTPQELQLQPGHVYAMQTPDDPIQAVYDARTVGQGIPILGSYLNEVLGDFGPDPATNPNFTRLATGPATVPDGPGGTLDLEGASGHSDYPRLGENGRLHTTGYNIAAVIAGLGTTNAIPGD